MSKEKKLIPELRFPEFKSDGEWQKKILEDVLDYERPDNYIVSDTDYQNEGIPVLTANKSFILGYTQEKFGIYSNLPAIIFDDFTVDSKYVDFPFKVKSSAIKILTPKKKDNLKFIYELFSQIRFEAKEHKRYYISEYQKIELPFPHPKEQKKIASCLSSLDEVITAHSQKLELLKDHKKGLMQNLFPQEGEKVPKYRFKEFEKDGEWSLKQLGVDNLIEIKGRIGYRGYTTEDIVSKGEGAISMSPSNIDENWNLNFEKSTYITWEKYEESPEIMLEDGFTALVKTGSSYGKAAFIKNLVEKTTINPQLVVLKPKQINSYFLYMLVTNTAVQKQIQETVVGGAIPTLSQDSISKFEVLIPKPKEQQKIAECFSALNDLIILQTQRIEQLKLHKKGLMQSFFPKIID